MDMKIEIEHGYETCMFEPAQPSKNELHMRALLERLIEKRIITRDAAVAFLLTL